VVFQLLLKDPNLYGIASSCNAGPTASSIGTVDCEERKRWIKTEVATLFQVFFAQQYMQVESE